MRILQQLPWLVYLVVCVALLALVVQREAKSRELVLRRTLLEGALAGEAQLRGRELDPDQRQAFESAWVEGQVLAHEARRRGLDRGDPLIRSSVLGRVRLSLAPELPTPTPELLRAWYERHRAEYRRPASVDLSLATFESDAAVPATAKARLEDGDAPEVVGPSRRIGSRLVEVSRRDLRLIFGEAFSNRVFLQEVGRWVGPIASGLGSHFVRVEAQHPAGQLPFEDVASLVRQDWIQAEEEERIAPRLDALRARYPVIPPRGTLEARLASRARLQGRPVSGEEAERIRQRLRDEEVLLAYARDEGLDRTSYVERRLQRKMRFLLRGAVPSPSEGELKALYDANPHRFVVPGRSEPLPFARIKDQLRALVAGPRARAVIEERTRALVRRYRIVIED